MSRSCICKKWLNLAVTDAALRSDPLLRALWLELVAWASAAVQEGCIRVPGSVLAWLSQVVTQPVTQVETQLRTLAELGLVALSEDGRALWLAGAQEAGRRAETARINGSKGGAPRKGESREAYLARKQGNLALPIQGGQAGTQITQPEPSAESSRTRAMKEESISSSPSHSPSSSRGREREPQAGKEKPSQAAYALSREVATILGLRFAAAEVIQEWLSAGATPEVIRRVVTAFASDPNRPEIRSPRYLSADVLEQARLLTPEAPNPRAQAYIAAMDAWIASGMRGPGPGSYENFTAAA